MSAIQRGHPCKPSKMGAYLSEPITTKESSVEENEGVRVAASSMQGWRVSQEVIFKAFKIITIATVFQMPRKPSN